MRELVGDIRQQLQRQRENRAPLVATRLVGRAGRYVVLTLAPHHAASLLGRGGSAAWETRVYVAQPPRFGIGVQPEYVVWDTDRGTALDRHEVLLQRLAGESFVRETSREILQAIHPLTDCAGEAFSAGDPRAATTALDEALRVASRLDAARHFLHLYVDVFLMRALILENADQEAAKAGYRKLITEHAEYPLHHPDTLRAVAQAREAVERLTPVPMETWNGVDAGSPVASTEGLR